MALSLYMYYLIQNAFVVHMLDTKVLEATRINSCGCTIGNWTFKYRTNRMSMLDAQNW